MHPCGAGHIIDGPFRKEQLTKYQLENGGCNSINLELLVDEDEHREQLEQQLTAIARSNVGSAVDLIDTYESVEQCFFSFERNVAETIRETVKGWDVDDVKWAANQYAKLWAESELPKHDFLGQRIEQTNN